jgi:peptidoglycan glycosyltransferase
VKALQFAGVQSTIDFAREMGLKSADSLIYDSNFYGLSLTLGGGEVTLLDMTNVYSTFANSGNEVDANPILRIEDAQGRTIYGLDPTPPGNEVLDPRIAYMITSILSDNRARTPAFGANSALKVSFPAAVKTGTTDDNRDSWTIGYTPSLTVGVWVGNNDNSEMAKVTGAIGGATVWHNFMEEFYKNPDFVELVKTDGTLKKDFVQPDGLVKRWACSEKGDINDLFLVESSTRGCTTYKDKGNKQLHAAPDTSAKPDNKPATRPTPIPGIVYPTPIP